MLRRNYPTQMLHPIYTQMQKTSLGSLLLTPPFTEGLNPRPVCYFKHNSTTQSHVTVICAVQEKDTE